MPITNKTRLIVFLTVLLTTPTSVWADSIANYFFKTIANPNLQGHTEKLLKAFESEQLQEAHDASLAAVEQAVNDVTIDKMSFARVLSNAAILDALAGERNEAINKTRQAVEMIEETDPFHPDLFNILMVSSYTHNVEDRHLEAEDTLRRAQHIVHRQDGVYTRRQIPVIESIAGIKIATGKFRDADQEQRFTLKVSEQAFGKGTEELMPTLARLGEYFANRGSSISISSIQEERLYRDRLFRDSASMYERSIAIIEDKYGDGDLRLIEPLKGLSRTKFLQGYGRIHAERPMERALEIVRTNPATDVADYAKALVSLGDLYTKTSDIRSMEMYKEAWALLSEDPAHEELRYELFGRPARLLPEAPIQPVLFRQPVDVEEGEELFVNIQYDIREDGKVRNSRVLDGNVPNADRKLMRDFVSTMRFRPRIKDGELQRTDGMTLHQTYEVRRKEPQKSLSITSGIDNGPTLN